MVLIIIVPPLTLIAARLSRLRIITLATATLPVSSIALFNNS
jgi:hypothetical protein